MNCLVWELLMTSLLLKSLRVKPFIARNCASSYLGCSVNRHGRSILTASITTIRTFATIKEGGYSFVDEDNLDMDKRIANAIAEENELKAQLNSHRRKKQPLKTNSFEKKPKIIRDYKLAVQKGTCVGCGAHLQSADDSKPGFMPSEVLTRLLNPESEIQNMLLNEFEEKQKDPTKEGVDLYLNKYKTAQVNENIEAFLLKHNMENNDENDDDEINEFQNVDDELDVDDMLSEEELKLLEKKEKLKNDIPTCQRCHRLRNYGVVEDNLRPGWSKYTDLQPAHFVELLSGIKESKCVVLTLIDVFDFHGSILPRLKEIVGNNPLHIAVNKVDLLPTGFSPDRVKQWVFQEARQHSGLDRLRLSDIHLISAKSGEGIGQLLDETRGHAKVRKGDVYVVGAANVGKSSLLNRLAKFDGGQSWGGGQGGKKLKKKKKEGGEVVLRKKGITTSSFPGTTLDLIKMDIGSGVHLIDTPGLILQHQLTTRLQPSELKAVVPLKKVDHVTLRLMEGKSILLGGLARIEFLEGRPFFVTLFVNHDVKVHPCSEQGAEADEFVKRHTGELLTPPFSSERDMGAMVEHNFQVEGDGWIQAGCDVVISGLGWFSVTGVGSCALRVMAPEGVMVVQRDPLMPFEAKDTMAKGTGGKLFKKVFKRKPRIR